MARVAQRRTSPPPYLLVAFVILFLLATAAAVLFWVQTDNLKAELADLQGKYRRVVSPQELSSPSPAVNEMLIAYDRGQERRTVLTQMSAKLYDLAQIITGTQASHAEARSEAESLADMTGISLNRGLVTEARELYQGLTQAQEEFQAMAAQNADLQDRIDDRDRTLEDLTAQFTAQVKTLEAQKQAADEKFRLAHEQYTAGQQQFTNELAQIRTELNMEIASKNQQLREMIVKLDAKDQTIERLRAELDKTRGMGGAEVAVRKPDGKVLQTKNIEGVCYINLGAEDRVIPGLAFTVYPTGGIPASGLGKAKIVVTQVQKTISECRIVDQAVDNPIVAGDPIGNVAYDPQRTYTFVVEGQFDVRGRGQYSADDAKEVKLLIERSGGAVADQVDVQTDFVVLGAAPARPLQPSENDPDHMWELYRAKEREFSRYQDTLEAAQNMHVPILNTNRFLAMIGYTPAAEQ